MMILADIVVFDAKPTARSMDDNGYMRVTGCNLTKEQVVPYLGMELPCCNELGLEPDKKYFMYRPAKELMDAVKSFDGVPLEFEHHDTDADNLPKDKIIGAVGTDGVFDSPYIKNTLIFHDAAAIKAIEDGEVTELSASYFFTPVMESGMFGGEHYDGIMRNIRGNHVALVRRGRAGPDVRVADSADAVQNNSHKDGNRTTADGDGMTDNEKKSAKDQKEGGTPMDDKQKKVADTEPDVKDTAPEKPNASNAPAVNPEPPAAAQGGAADPDAGKVKTEDAELAALKDAMTVCGLDAENEGLRNAFDAGRKWASEQKKEEPKEPEKKAEGEPEKKAEGDSCTEGADDAKNDNKGIAPEEVEKIKDEAVKATQDSFVKLFTAAKDCESIIGTIEPAKLVAMDADTIYEKALTAKGINLEGMHKSAYPAMLAYAKANDAKTAAAAAVNDSADNTPKEETIYDRILKAAQNVRCEE